MKMHIKYNILIISLLSTISLYAGTNPAAYLKEGVGARALGMGGAFTAIADDATAAYWNPAGLGQIDRLSFSSMVQKLGSVEYDTLNNVNPDYEYATVVMPLTLVGLPSYGVVGLSWISNSLDNIPWVTVDASNQTHEDTFNDTENAYILSYGSSVLDQNIYAGLNIKYLQQEFSKISDASATGYGFEGGLLYHATQRLSLGFIIDSGITMKWANSHEDRGLFRNRLGCAYKIIQQEKISFLAATDVVKASKRSLESHIGCEFAYKPKAGNNSLFFEQLALRAGIDGLTLENKYNEQSTMNEDINWTMGTGFTFTIMQQELGFDYSFGSYRFGARHRFSIALLFS